MSHFRVYLTSKVKEGCKKTEVLGNISKSLNLKPEQTKNFLESEVLIKANLDLETALKYQERFDKLGAVCRIEDTNPAKQAAPTRDNKVTTNAKTKSKQCVSCDKPIEAIAERCQFCGSSQTEIVEETATPLGKIWIALGMLLLAGLGLGAFFLLK